MADLKLTGAPLAGYDHELRTFFKFWYGHMLGDLMQPPLADVDHATARYIWDAARRAAPIAAQLDQDAERPPRVITEETAQQYMEESLWAFIECAGNFPSIKPDARIWPHVMAYVPKPE